MALAVDAEEGPERDTLTRSAKKAEATEIDGDLLLHVANDPRCSPGAHDLWLMTCSYVRRDS